MHSLLSEIELLLGASFGPYALARSATTYFVPFLLSSFSLDTRRTRCGSWDGLVLHGVKASKMDFAELPRIFSFRVEEKLSA